MWQHLTDIERWHEWNPFQKQASGDGLQVQSIMHFKVVEISQRWTSSSKEQVDAVEAPSKDENGEGERARWVYKYTGLLAAIGGVSSVRETVRFLFSDLEGMVIVINIVSWFAFVADSDVTTSKGG